MNSLHAAGISRVLKILIFLFAALSRVLSRVLKTMNSLQTVGICRVLKILISLFAALSRVLKTMNSLQTVGICRVLKRISSLHLIYPGFLKLIVYSLIASVTRVQLCVVSAQNLCNLPSFRLSFVFVSDRQMSSVLVNS